ncbi:biopolymer transporter ExbD [Candidatus Latescibacterota bacterium]
MMKRRTVSPDISIINLIDVMLVLLVIFMMTAPTIQQWIDVDLPSAEVSKVKITEGIVVSITDKGDIYVDREKIELKNFSDRFADIMKNRSGEPVFIRADSTVSYGNVIDVLGVAKKLGGENVGLVIEEEKTSGK